MPKLRCLLALLGLLLAASSSHVHQIGAELNVQAKSSISPQEVQLILDGKKRGVKESIYYLGLLHLYGISFPLNASLALENFLEAADLGHIEAQTACGVLLLSSSTSIESRNQAEKYLSIAADNNDLNGQFFLAKLYLDINGYARNDSTMVRAYAYLTRVVESHTSIAEASHYLGVMCEYGLGVRQDFKAAVEHYTRASSEQYAESMYNLGLMRVYGRGVAQDSAGAGALFLSAASAGHAPSMYYMGMIKSYGTGVAVDYTEALHWFDLAAARDDLRVLAKAVEAATSMRALLERAHIVNKEIVSEFDAGAES